MYNQRFRVGTQGAVTFFEVTEAGSSMRQAIETKMPHLFAIKVLDKLPGFFKPRRYLYHCVRCKWSFVVNDGRRGALRPIAEDGITLTRDEVVARGSTFAAGPCPAMRRLTDAHLHMNGSNGHVSTQAETYGHPQKPLR